MVFCTGWLRRAPRHSGRVALAAASLLSLTTIAWASVVATPAGASGIVPPSNPPADIPATLPSTCSVSSSPDNSATCTAAVLALINSAAAQEGGVATMVLPVGYDAMSTAEQLWVVINLERQDRGLPVIPETDGVLNQVAATAAAVPADPEPPSQYLDGVGSSGGFGSVEATGEASALFADYIWMYDDGWGGSTATTPNAGCTSATAPGCWGHRDNILGSYPADSSLTPLIGAGGASTTCGSDPCPTYAVMLVDSVIPAASPEFSWASLDFDQPKVTGVTPSGAAAPGAGTAVTITGVNFSSPATVDFGTVPATDVTVVSPTEITADAPADPDGTATDTVAVTVTAGGVTSAPNDDDTFTYTAPGAAPTVAGISPGFGSASGGTTVTITGSNFVAVTTVTFGSVPAPFTVVSSSQITATTPAGLPGEVPVVVSSAGGSSSPVTFDYTAPGHGGYDLVGSDGGVFVLPTGQPGGYYGSLPGLNPPVVVHNIVGIVPSSDDKGYFLVGSDGGVFSFGDTTYEGSLPGLHVAVNDIVGIVPTTDDKGYFLVGRDGGVFSFGDSTYEGSLPGDGISVDDVTGIAATSDDRGYWVVASNGTVYAFGDAASLGNATGTGSNAVGIASTPDGKGYWVVDQNGDVVAEGDAGNFGDLPSLGVTPARPVVAIVPTNDANGYWLIGSDGGVFSFGDATSEGSLPGLGVSVDDVVGAVPTA